MGKLVGALLRWFSSSARGLPWRRTRDPYAIWVSEIMLQQTQVKTVIPYWERWMRELPTAESLAKAGPSRIHKLWEGLGYYTRVRNMQKAAQRIVSEHGGKFPRGYDDILALPGIGRYTAGAISSIAFNEPRPILDGNVIRVLTRVFGIAENPREKMTNERLWHVEEELVMAAVALRSSDAGSNRCSHLNQSIMELGALICTPRNPNCPACPLHAECAAFKTGRIEKIPNCAPRTVATSRNYMAFVIEHRGRFLVRQRPEGIVNAHLWEFPNIEIKETAKPTNAARRLLGFSPKSLELLCTIKHSITRYRIALTACRVTLNSAEANRAVRLGRWVSLPQARRLAFTSAHGKILRQISKSADRRRSWQTQ